MRMTLWKNPSQSEDTFAIVTVEANEMMAPVHNRLAPRDYQEYLENGASASIRQLVIRDGETECGSDYVSMAGKLSGSLFGPSRWPIHLAGQVVFELLGVIETICDPYVIRQTESVFAIRSYDNSR